MALSGFTKKYNDISSRVKSLPIDDLSPEDTLNYRVRHHLLISSTTTNIKLTCSLARHVVAIAGARARDRGGQQVQEQSHDGHVDHERSAGRARADAVGHAVRYQEGL